MRKKFISLLLVLAIISGSFSVGIGNITSVARVVGVGTGAESFNPVDFYLSKDVFIGTDVNVYLNVQIIDSNYRVRINSVEAYIPYYTEGGISYLDVDYSAGKVVSGAASFLVTGKINADANSVVRYTIGYDILDKSGDIVWKNLTGYTYGFVSGTEAHTGPIGTYHDYPGQLSLGCYFEVLETLNTVYVQQSELMLDYKIRTQAGLTWAYSDARTRGVNVISGNAPSTTDTMPDNNDAPRDGQMDWPKCDAIYRSAGGRWIAITEPPSGYYKFTVSFNSWNDDWEDQSNITETTEMYYITNADRVAALNAAEKIIKTKNTFADGYYLQKGFYTEESWNNLIKALDNAYQVVYSVPDANYGYKVACQQAGTAAANVDAAFADLEYAEHDFYTYKDPVVKEATCTEDGSRLLTCLCGEQKTEVIPANGHVQGEWNVITEPTCTDEGFEEIRCTVCNEVVKEKTLGVIAHSYVKTVTPPTCTERGYTTNVCSECGDTYTSDYVDAKGHAYESEVIAPTCTKRGCTVYICYVCSSSYTDNYTEVIPHDYIAQTIEPTCKEKGFTTYTCSVCSDTYTDNYVDENDHDYETTVVEPTCTGKGFTTYTCSVCSDTYIDNYVDESDHVYETTVVEPTKTEEGYTVYQCKNCDYNYNDDFVPALGEGVTVSGTVKSFATNAENSETTETKIELIRAGEEESAYTTSVVGTGIQNYSFEKVEEGIYILRVSKENHATREYEVTVTSEEVTAELVIHLSGDINGDGKVNTIDTARVNSHARSIAALVGYEQTCADINNDGKINTVDAARMNAHARGIAFLW